MSSSRALARAASSALRSDVCAFCCARQTLPIGRNSTRQLPLPTSPSRTVRRNYAQRLDVKRLRADVDKKSRLGWFKLNRQQKILLVEPHVAEALYSDFAAHKDRDGHAKLVKQLMTKYNVSSEQISGLALIVYSIPDLSDPAKRAQLPPSPHKPTAGLLLQACADLADPLAVKHILAAVYLNTYTHTPSARPIALLFAQPAIKALRATLPSLTIATSPDPEALTLHGLFLEQDARPTHARAAYEAALQVPWVYTFSAFTRHPAALPIPAPWIALGALLSADKDPAVRAQAQAVYEQGATKGDDPLAYWELARFYDRGGARWLKCVSKAAASGHRAAMVEVARFYRDLALERVDANPGVSAALNWLVGWRAGSPAALAEEWFEAAGRAGHKGALVEFAEWLGARGRTDEAREVLGRVVAVGEHGVEEEFPQAVLQAKGMLSGIRTR